MKLFKRLLFRSTACHLLPHLSEVVLKRSLVQDVFQQRVKKMGIQNMVKKDRIAIVVSVVYALFPLYAVFEGSIEESIIFILPIVIYWGYRFIKGDISFIKMQDD
ncbi:hypothetical protein [Acinetobacter sp. A3]|uniref:hypothetical protein n=1 Tax=Acinetobacter sp. A3 TaxID=2725492 RepID=UPI001C0A410F|nr:hypothetical protein [Acinetobacter sp. A3]